MVFTLEGGSIRIINITQYGTTLWREQLPVGKAPPPPGGYPFRTVISGSPAHKGPQTWLRGTFCCFRKIEGG